MGSVAERGQRVLNDAGAIAAAERVGDDVLAPNAERSDLGLEPPRENIAALARAGLLGLTVPREHGGVGATEITVVRVFEALARRCGLSAFLLAQHTGVCRSIAAAGLPLAREVLPHLADGTLVAAIGASQLRRAGVPLLQARRVSGGYRLDGTVPWASGRGLMTHIALGATGEDGIPLFFWLPFEPMRGLELSAPMDLAVMRGSNTVAITCRDLAVADDRLIYRDTAGAWSVQHGGALSNPIAFLLGVGSACLEQLTARVARVGSAAQRERAADEAGALEALRERYYALLERQGRAKGDGGALDAMLELRVAVSAAVVHLAGLAIAAEGGGAHLRSNPAQRHLREASFFCTVTVNAAAREALVTGF